MVQHDACTTQQELKAQVNTDADSQPHKPGGEQEVVHLVYMAAHGPNTPLSYRDAAQGVPKESQGTPYIILIKRGLFQEYLYSPTRTDQELLKDSCGLY